MTLKKIYSLEKIPKNMNEDVLAASIQDQEELPKYRSLTIHLKCSTEIPYDMTNEEFEKELLKLLTTNGKFNFHGQLDIKNRN